MKNTDLVKFYNMLSWYFCNHAKNGIDDIQTKMSDPCEKLLEELQEFYKAGTQKMTEEGGKR